MNQKLHTPSLLTLTGQSRGHTWLHEMLKNVTCIQPAMCPAKIFYSGKRGRQVLEDNQQSLPPPCLSFSNRSSPIWQKYRSLDLETKLNNGLLWLLSDILHITCRYSQRLTNHCQREEDTSLEICIRMTTHANSWIFTWVRCWRNKLFYGTKSGAISKFHVPTVIDWIQWSISSTTI